MTRRARLVAVLAACLAVVAGAAIMLGRPHPSPALRVDLGGPFALVDVNGRPFTDRDLRGRPAALFFGFTTCPEVCPTTLARWSAALKTLGPDGDKLRAVFVSVDPQRDTPAVLKRYLSDFDPRIVGLTGSPQAVAGMLAAYHVYARKVPLEGGGYTMDHTAATYLFDRDGGFQGLIGYQEPVDTQTAKLKALAEGRPPPA